MTEKAKNIELYSIFVETIMAAEQRRQQVSSIYYSILLAVTAFLGSEIKVDTTYVTISLSVISLIFFGKIRYFRKLATAKFAVINALESEWDVRPFDMEWAEFKKDKRFHFSGYLTHLEAVIPLVVALGGFIYLAYSFVPKIPSMLWC